jgi:serine/threonine protein phosphatase PrpC
MPIIASSALTHAGLRRNINEDAIVNLPDQGLWVVADGMGGHSKGDYASQAITRALEDLTIVKDQDLSQYLLTVAHCVRSVNDHLVVRSTELDSGVIGATLAALVVDGCECGIIWVGDSRVYRLRDGIFKQLTVDHSFVNELIDQGNLSIEEASSHPDANAITRAVGASNDLKLDQKIETVLSGDRYLLCSDGLYRDVTDSNMQEAMISSSTCEETRDCLLKLALDSGGKDNISLVVVDAK